MTTSGRSATGWLAPLLPSMPVLGELNALRVGRFEDTLAELLSQYTITPHVEPRVRGRRLARIRHELAVGGFLGLAVPAHDGGSGGPAVLQALMQFICGYHDADLRDATGLGHGRLIARQAATPVRERWLPRLVAGDLAGIAITEDYARAALQRGNANATKEEIDRLLQARMGRQAVLTKDPPLRLWAIVDEAALHRPVGGPEVMKAQLDRLAESADFSHVTLQALPYDVGGHPGMAGSFVLLRFGEPATSDVVYIESQAGDLFLESETNLSRFNAIFEHLRALALPPDASVSLIQAIARDL